jgi:sulfite reductase (ferredoxin)
MIQSAKTNGSNGDARPESKIESIKRASCSLRGGLAGTLASDDTHFTDDDTQVLKPHGVYQQDDRDLRCARRRAGIEPDYAFMVRVGIPGGVLTAEQYLALDALASEAGDGTLRLTVRQGVQFHGVRKPHLRETIARVNERLMTTLGACGDVHRNVLGCRPCRAAPRGAGHREAASPGNSRVPRDLAR